MIERSARQPKLAPRLNLSAEELKLYAAAWLAMIYTASWFAIQGPSLGPSSHVLAEPPAVSAPRRPEAASAAARQRRSAARIRTRSS